MPRTSLRVVLLLMAALAGLKVWAQDRYYRSVMHEALIGAYKEKATAVCLKASPKLSRAGTQAIWNNPEIVIGSKDTEVAIWDYDNPLWNVRYRHPNLVLTAGANRDVRCSFDLIAGLAKVDGGIR